MEVVKTNIIGTDNDHELCSSMLQKRSSTDKAAFIQFIQCSFKSSCMISSTSSTIVIMFLWNKMVCIVSRGSIFHCLVKQIKMYEPLTVTNPKMTRFMMSLDDDIIPILMVNLDILYKYPVAIHRYLSAPSRSSEK